MALLNDVEYDKNSWGYYDDVPFIPKRGGGDGRQDEEIKKLKEMIEKNTEKDEERFEKQKEVDSKIVGKIDENTEKDEERFEKQKEVDSKIVEKIEDNDTNFSVENTTLTIKKGKTD